MTTPEIPQVNDQEQSATQVSSARKVTHRSAFLAFSAFAIFFWLIEFIGQYYWISKGDMAGSLIRSFALSGETFFGAALFSSAVFKWFPRLARHWRIRRYFGVGGVVFISLHIFFVYKYVFNFNLAAPYSSLNIFENPLLFGTLAYPIFFVMAMTSTDWAVRKLGRRWKFIHRFVYIAYILSVFHFVLTNPAALKNPFGYFLIALTALALFGQLHWFFKTVYPKRFKTLGALVGFAIIILTLLLAFSMYLYRFSK